MVRFATCAAIVLTLWEPTITRGEPRGTVQAPPACHDDRDGPRLDSALGRCERDTLEIIGLYGSMGGLGLGLGAIVAARLDLGRDATAIPALALGAAGALGVLWMDRAHDGMPDDLPMTINSGLMIGAMEGLVGSMMWSGELIVDGTSEAMWLAAGLGGGLGYLLGTTVRPTAGDNALIRASTGWGGFYGYLVSLLAREDSDHDRFRMVFTGLNVGLVSGVVLTQVVSPTRLQMFYVDVGVVLGMGVGLAVLGDDVKDTDDRSVGMVLAISALSGMILGALVAPRKASVPEAAPELGLGPVPGGAMLTLSGAL